MNELIEEQMEVVVGWKNKEGVMKKERGERRGAEHINETRGKQ